MLMITLAMLGGSLFASALEVNFSATGDVTSDALSCISQCPMNPKSMSPDMWCVSKNCYKQLGKCAFDWACRKTLECENKCTGPLAGVEGADEFVGVQQCLKANCPGFPPSVGCIAKNCKMAAAKCALKSSCRHTLDCAHKCIPSIVDVALAQTEDDEELKATDEPATMSDAMSCLSQCPMDPDTMSPSYWCVIRKCFKKLGKCILNSNCRGSLKCMGDCPKALAKTKDALRFIEFETCINDRCPGFPPNKLCIATHCTSEATKCGIHSSCRGALMCADKCIPKTSETIAV